MAGREWGFAHGCYAHEIDVHRPKSNILSKQKGDGKKTYISI